jgi:tetratricopeptide (TPR) repeat protein
MSTLSLKKSAMVFAVASMLASPAFAAGGGSDGGGNSSGGNSSGGNSRGDAEQCPAGKVYNKKSKSCAKKSSQLDDNQIYQFARQFAYAGKYDEALDMLKRAKNQNDPRILNYYGYTNRKLGNVEIAMDYYKRAIAIDGNYLLARSYMGQGLVQQGDLEGARVQLVEIRDRGGKDTYAYRALYEALKSGSTY